MPLPRSRRRRAWIGPALGGLVALAGCQGAPTLRPTSITTSPPPPAAAAEPAPAPAAAPVPPAVAPIPKPEPPPHAELPPLPAAATGPAISPEALRRAEALARAALVEDSGPATKPEPTKPPSDAQLFLSAVPTPSEASPPVPPEPAAEPPDSADGPVRPPTPSREPASPADEDVRPDRGDVDAIQREDDDPGVARRLSDGPRSGGTPLQGVAGPGTTPLQGVPPTVGEADPTGSFSEQTKPTGDPVPEPALEVAELAICRRVRGFGDIDSWGASAPKRGQAVLIYGAWNGVRFEPAGAGVRSRLAATLELLPAGGDRPLWSHPLKDAEDRCESPRREYYVVYRVVLPDSVPPGPYRLRLRARDLVAGRDAERTIPITLAR
ncbi:MAG TPA: hypothetical protein VG406_12770 [Isosphaeraceae bacterium]|jgi:hypothetical protein|nr:hypothetical protein [Isosphaeraceae bacterium]